MRRREVLRAMAASSLMGWIGCARSGLVAGAVERVDPDDARASLRDAIERLSRFGVARGFAAISTEDRAAVDGAERGSLRIHSGSAVLSLLVGGRRREAVVRELSRGAFDRAIADLTAGAAAQRRPPYQPGSPESIRPRLADDPATSAETAWLTRAAELAERARSVGSSRLVHRRAMVETQDLEVIVVANRVDRSERRVRSRARFATVGWLGDTPSAALAERATVDGIATIELGDAALAAAAAHALELTTAGAPMAGPTALVLAPAVVAEITRAAIVDAMLGRRWPRGPLASHGDQPFASERVSIVDDAAVPSVGSYAFDDVGASAAATTLVEAGRCKTPLATPDDAASLGMPATPHSRRAGATGPLRSLASCVAVAAGGSSLDELLDEGAAGYLLEDPRPARVDLGRWQLELEVGRARRFERGARTGHVYRDVLVRADLSELLRGVALASSDRQVLDQRDPTTGLWRTTAAPWWLSRGAILSRGES